MYSRRNGGLSLTCLFTLIAFLTVNPADVALPSGYRIEAAATGLTFPTGVTFDARGQGTMVWQELQ